MKFVAFWTVGDAGPYKFVRLFRTRARVFVSLPLEGKGAKVEKKPCYGFFEVLLTADTWFLTTEWEAKNRSVNADPLAVDEV